MSPPKIAALADELANAPEAPGGEPPPDAPPPGDPRAEPPQMPERPRGTIWAGCPVIPLGVNGEEHYYLDVHGQLCALKKHERDRVMRLFGHKLGQLFIRFPTSTRSKRDWTNFDAADCAAAMIQASAEKGLFDPTDAVRGVGAWRDDDGLLIYHLGSGLLIDGELSKTTEHQGKIYPAAPPIPHPAAPGGPDPLPEIMEVLESWSWARPEIDPVLAFGMVCAQMLGGALDWRPTVWVTGGAASGKSQFQKLLEHLHGPRGMIQAADATKAGITARLGHSSLPVSIDELEPGDEGSSKERDIVMLARIASSGAQWLRGTVDQKGASGNVFASFLFSSILIPAVLKPQDVQRLIILRLDTLPQGLPPLKLRAETWRARGAQLKRRLIDRWPSYATRLALWREALEEAKIGGRDADNWATLLALAGMAMSDDLPQEAELTSWAARIAAELAGAERSSDADDMLLHLLTQPLDIYRRGEQHTVAQWLRAAAQIPGAPMGLLSSAEEHGSPQYVAEVNRKLSNAGLRVDGKGQEARLFIANRPFDKLKQLFAHSQWRDGAWQQSARRIPGATPAPHPLHLGGIGTRGTWIPFAAVAGLSHWESRSSPSGASRPPDIAEDGF